MSLPAWDISGLTPSLVDGFQYTAGFHTNEGGWIGTFTTAAGQYGAPLEVISAQQVYRADAWPANQWAAYQTIVPFDDAPGSSVGVRCGNGSGYFLHNVAYTSGGGWWFTLYRYIGGAAAMLAQWTYGDQNPDGAFVILEVEGSASVHLRASVAYSPWGLPPLMYDPSNRGPHTFPAQASTPHLLGTFTDSTASRILSGVPGVGYGFNSTAGGFYGFNAGEVYTLTAIAGTVTGNTVTLSGTRATGTTVTVT